MGKKNIKLISWNVNGLRACIRKGFKGFLAESQADFFCVQEIKMMKEQEETNIEGYHQFWNSAERKGYSGTLVLSKEEPINVSRGIGIEEHSHEGRVITLETENFYLVNVYTPNSKDGLLRLDYRMKFEDDFRNYLSELDCKKPVIICGDMNVAHNEIDLKNPKTNRRNAGFTDEERGKFQALLDTGFTDSFRFLYPDTVKYSWWSYRFNARKNNSGWRIDYFLVSDRIKNNIRDSVIHNEVFGSDHCPVGLEIEF